MRSELRQMAAKVLTRGSFDAFEEEIIDALSQDSDEADPERIARIMEWTTSTVPFYRNLGSTVASLQDLPVIDKALIKAQPDAFITDGADRSTLTARSTSGSTGIPFTVYVDAPRVHRNKAGAAATLKYTGGNPFAPIVRAKQWGRISAKDRALYALKEYYAAHADRFRATDAEPMAEWIKKRRSTTIQGYPSYLEMIFRVMEDSGMQFPAETVSSVVSAAEAPTPYFFGAAHRLFGIQAHARYSNMELGVMSISAKHAYDTYKFDISSFHVEILAEDSDEPVPFGELGRIVVTDLHNRAMPLLRYDTGDMGRFGTSPSGEPARNSVTDLHGRRLDVLVGGTESSPRRIHPLAVWGPAATLGEVRQFQLRQHGVGRYTWVLNAERSPQVEEKLRAALDERVGDVISCDFQYAEEMPVLASGKRQFFVNEIEDPLDYIQRRS